MCGWKLVLWVLSGLVSAQVNFSVTRFSLIVRECDPSCDAATTYDEVNECMRLSIPTPRCLAFFYFEVTGTEEQLTDYDYCSGNSAGTSRYVFPTRGLILPRYGRYQGPATGQIRLTMETPLTQSCTYDVGALYMVGSAPSCGVSDNASSTRKATGAVGSTIVVMEAAALVGGNRPFSALSTTASLSACGSKVTKVEYVDIVSQGRIGPNPEAAEHSPAPTPPPGGSTIPPPAEPTVPEDGGGTIPEDGGGTVPEAGGDTTIPGIAQTTSGSTHTPPTETQAGFRIFDSFFLHVSCLWLLCLAIL